MARYRPMPALMAAAATALLLSGCSGGEETPPIKPKSEVDMGAWKDVLISNHNASSNPDMDKLYELTADQCDDTLDEMRTGLAIAIDNHYLTPDTTRTNMMYVCPGREHIVDDALKAMQETDAKIREACRAPKELRTSDQKMWTDLEGC
ncbi:hypothetical protein BN970_05052 [Mycolicibacterium conceptionense]|uniref:DUF732 domain-containing protein n=2 Tax=Mycolicibacterium conceptionense TaxID=451644 RepID=A0A0U1DRN3_9MYCO|nr:hypothetical protein BN970_05052 [Mycolicibacterium conceptionense]